MGQRMLFLLSIFITILIASFTFAELVDEVAKETVAVEEFMHRLKTALQDATPEEQCKAKAAFQMIVADIEEMILKHPDGNFF